MDGRMKGGREAILERGCVVLGSLCSLSHPTAGYYPHAHTHKQNTTEISMTIVFQPVGVTKQGDHSVFLTDEERVKVSLTVQVQRNHLLCWLGPKTQIRLKRQAGVWAAQRGGAASHVGS